jgi:gluconolactonase
MSSNPARYEIHDRRFVELIEPGATLERLATGCLWAEGPSWDRASGSLVFSDVRRNRMLRYTEETGEFTFARQPSDFSNGNTRDLDGQLITCEHGTRRVTRTETDGSRTVLVDRFEGKRFNSPNDVVVTSDAAIWFTDPTYGIDSFDEGFPAESEIGSSNVYRLDSNGSISAVITDMVRPNGLAFSLDESALYVADTGFSHVENGPRHIRRYDVDISSGQVAGGGKVFATCRRGCYDGFRVDELDNVWTSAGKGVDCYGPNGQLLGSVVLPEECANVDFGGPDGRTLYATATTSLYRLRIGVAGALSRRPIQAVTRVDNATRSE